MKKPLLHSLLALATSLSIGASPAQAAAEKLVLADQYGLPYLLLTVAKDQKFIETRARQNGIEELTVEWHQVPGGPEIIAALLSGSIDIGAGGLAPLLTLWDRTHGKENVRAIAGLSAAPSLLVTNRADIQSVKDFKPTDRIAVPGVKVSGQARYLQMAAAQAFGEEQWERLDSQTVSMSHPDATSALLAGKTEIVAHMSSAPFQYEVLARPGFHAVFSSYDVLGQGATSTVAFATEKFRQERPQVYQSFLQALDDASRFIKEQPESAARIFKTATNSNLSEAAILELIRNPDFSFDTTPAHTQVLAEFLYKVGSLKRKPEAWQEYFFEGTGNSR